MKDSTRDTYTPTDPAAQAIGLRRAAEQLEVAERNCAGNRFPISLIS